MVKSYGIIEILTISENERQKKHFFIQLTAIHLLL